MLSGSQALSIREADTGAEGLRLIRADRPDLVLLDVRLPDIDGFAVMDRLQADAETAGIPVIVCTSSMLTHAERTRLGRARSILPKASLTRETVQRALAVAWQDDNAIAGRLAE
jgi:CheY-like chemotaxis protein